MGNDNLSADLSPVRPALLDTFTIHQSNATGQVSVGYVDATGTHWTGILTANNGAVTYYIELTGNDANSGLSLADAKRTLASAVNAAGIARGKTTFQLGLGDFRTEIGQNTLLPTPLLSAYGSEGDPTSVIQGTMQTIAGPFATTAGSDMETGVIGATPAAIDFYRGMFLYIPDINSTPIPINASDAGGTLHTYWSFFGPNPIPDGTVFSVVSPGTTLDLGFTQLSGLQSGWQLSTLSIVIDNSDMETTEGNVAFFNCKFDMPDGVFNGSGGLIRIEDCYITCDPARPGSFGASVDGYAWSAELQIKESVIENSYIVSDNCRFSSELNSFSNCALQSRFGSVLTMQADSWSGDLGPLAGMFSLQNSTVYLKGVTFDDFPNVAIYATQSTLYLKGVAGTGAPGASVATTLDNMSSYQENSTCTLSADAGQTLVVKVGLRAISARAAIGYPGIVDLDTSGAFGVGTMSRASIDL